MCWCHPDRMLATYLLVPPSYTTACWVVWIPKQWLVPAFLQDSDKVVAAAGGISLLALGIYVAKRGTGVIASYVSARLGKPSLVRDTSRFSVFETFKHPVKTVQKIRKSPQDALSGVILEPTLEARLRDVAIATKNTKLNGGMYRNLLFYGPPGTGKTMFAKKLAMHR